MAADAVRRAIAPLLVAFLTAGVVGCGASEAGDGGPAVGDGAVAPSPSALDCAERIDRQVAAALDSFGSAADAAQAAGHGQVDDPAVPASEAAAAEAGAAAREHLDQLPELASQGCPEWDAERAAEALEVEARRRMEELEASGEELDADGYAELNALAIVAAVLRPAPTFAVPDGFPIEFPVAEGARLVRSSGEGDVVTAAWEVPAARFREVADFYESALQNGVIGRWSVNRSSGGATAGPDGTVVSGDERYDVTGYDRTGTVAITLPEGGDVVEVEATLAPSG